MASLLTAVFVLSIMIFVHELGHYLAARKAGVGVEKFSIGFGPRIWGMRRGETDYMISAIPFGGYVKMVGDKGQGLLMLDREFGSRVFKIPLAPEFGNAAK